MDMYNVDDVKRTLESWPVGKTIFVIPSVPGYPDTFPVLEPDKLEQAVYLGYRISENNQSAPVYVYYARKQASPGRGDATETCNFSRCFGSGGEAVTEVLRAIDALRNELAERRERWEALLV